MKTFDTIEELKKDPHFMDELEKLIDSIHTYRNRRTPPKPGFHYRRDWYDRMTSANQMNVGFFNDNFEAVIGKTSNLPSQTRQIVIHVYNEVFNSTLLAYQKEEKK